MVVRSIYFDVLDNNGSKGLTYFFERFTTSRISHQAVGEIRVHSAPVPIKITERFAMPVDSNSVLLANSLKEVTGNPHFIARPLGTLSKNLKFPLTRCHFGINTFDIKAGIQARI